MLSQIIAADRLKWTFVQYKEGGGGRVKRAKVKRNRSHVTEYCTLARLAVEDLALSDVLLVT